MTQSKFYLGEGLIFAMNVFLKRMTLRLEQGL